MGRGGPDECPNHLPREACVTPAGILFFTLPRVERDEERRYVVPSAANLERRRKLKKIRSVFLNQTAQAICLLEKERQKKRLTHMLQQIRNSPTPPEPTHTNACNLVLLTTCYDHASLLIH